MGKISCNTNKCPNKIKYYHDLEECYYCKSCVHTLSKKDECTKIGNKVRASTSSDNLELEELKQQHLDEINEVKRKYEQVIEALETENKKLSAQVVEAEQELDKLKNQPKDSIDGISEISYNAFEDFCKQFIGEQITINSGSTLTFDLNKDKWVDLIKALSKHSLPEISQLNLNYVPAASQEVRDFMTNSPAQNVFYFNFTKQVHLVGSRYFEALKAVAARTSEVFHLSYTSFSADEFWEIIKAAKHVREVGFRAGTIHFYNEKDFLDGMENCKIEHISLEHLGSHGIGNWAKNPVRFENLIASISKCAPLANSLKTLNIRCCDVTRDEAQGILDKYNLNEVSLDGV